MRKMLAFVFATLAIVGTWFLVQNFRLEGLDSVRLRSRQGNASDYASLDEAPAVTRSTDTIRVASFNVQVFGRTKLEKPHVMDLLARIARRFDLLAIQEIRSREQDLLPRFVDLINATGARYDYVIGPPTGRTSSTEQFAYVFDRSSLEVDRNQLYSVHDPDDLLHREPFVAWFRVRGPDARQAFTFTVVNVHTDPDEIDRELNVLDDVFRAVRDDGRNEDDVLLVGDFNADENHLGELGRMPGVITVIRGMPTNTRSSHAYDNLLFHQAATTEFTGRGGVFDFLREYNLTLEAALEVSDHLPVWAEFTIYEGGRAGRVAQGLGEPKRRG